jgi:hypothetical protein
MIFERQECPCCPHGRISVHGVCDACGVGMPADARRLSPSSGVRRRTPKRRQDQNELQGLGEYAQTRKDQEG